MDQYCPFFALQIGPGENEPGKTNSIELYSGTRDARVLFFGELHFAIRIPLSMHSTRLYIGQGFVARKDME